MECCHINTTHWKDELHNLRYYHPNIKNMDELLTTMQKYAKIDGSFLLRNSFSNNGAFTISVIHRGGVKHLTVLRDITNCCFFHDQPFSTATALVEYYKYHDVSNKEAISGIRLTRPVQDNTRFMTDRITSEPGLRPPMPIPRFDQEMTNDECSRCVKCGSCTRSNLFSSGQSLNSSRSSSVSRNGTESQRSTISVSSTSLDANRNCYNTLQRDRITSTSEQPVENVSKVYESMKKETLGIVDDFKSLESESGVTLYRKLIPKSLNSNLSNASDGTYTYRHCHPAPSSSPSIYYSEARDINSENLTLLMISLEETDYCECGLSVSESEFGNGWSVHLTQYEAGQTGHGVPPIFFMGPDEQSVWWLPIEVHSGLTEEEKKRLKSIISRTGRVRTDQSPGRDSMIQN